MGDLAALSRIRSTMLRASAKTWLGVSQPPVAANVAGPRQHRQKPRRESKCRRAKVMVSSLHHVGCTNAATHWPWIEVVLAPRKPMVGTLVDFCARAASGHATAPSIV